MADMQGQPIRLLMVEDLEADAERTLYHLKRAGMACDVRRVETGPALKAALDDFSPTLILSDFSLPQFDGLSALQMCQQHAADVPFIFLSGTIGEERAVAALQAGASDYVLKGNMARLVPAVRRAISDAQVKSERLHQQAQIERLNRLLRMLKAVNDAAMRCRDRTELLTETCRIAISMGSYSMAVAAITSGGGSTIRALASSGQDAPAVAQLRAYVEDSGAKSSSIVASVFRSGREFVCNEATPPPGTAMHRLMALTGGNPVVLLPLTVDGEVSAVLLLVGAIAAPLAKEELAMLQDLARSLSFNLQYVYRDVRAKFLSNFDPQTGLARRSLFCDRVRDQLLAAGARAEGHVVVVFDVRRLSALNDSFGRHAGDQLLRAIADSLKKTFARQEQLAHFGGGTFALLLKVDGATDTTIQQVILQQVHVLANQPFHISGRDIPVSLRIACARYPEDGSDAKALVQHAETALQVARATGLSYARFDPAVQSHSVGQLALEHRLRQALERREFELHYQPKVNVVTRRIQGAEALLRWRSKDEGLMPPAAFLPVLESSGLILPVGEWVIERAALDCQEWLKAGLAPVRVAVNVAPAQLQQPEFEEHLLRCVQSLNRQRRGLDVEITEGVLQDECMAEIKKLERLRAAGIRIAIDDFGTGYSSLARLASLPVDTLKIDRRFINQMVHNPPGATVVKTVVTLARAFGMTSVAEGVERQEELDLLWQMNCDQSQGFLHSAALPADEFAAMLREGKGALVQPPADETEAA